jgi:hypothetical protein
MILRLLVAAVFVWGTLPMRAVMDLGDAALPIHAWTAADARGSAVLLPPDTLPDASRRPARQPRVKRAPAAVLVPAVAAVISPPPVFTALPSSMAPARPVRRALGRFGGLAPPAYLPA